MTARIEIPPHGHVEVLSHMGDDLTVVNAARVSFSKHSDWIIDCGCNGAETCQCPRYLSDKDVGLINYLAAHKHWTPFAHPQITFRIKLPIFVARQLMRSNVGVVFNEVSRRYVDGPPQFWSPHEWRGRPAKSIKQGSGDPLSDEEGKDADASYARAVWEAEQGYKRLLSVGVAPEMARTVLPLSTYTEVWATMSLAAAARICGLREKPDAQVEIQEVCRAMGKLTRERFPVSWAALTKEAT